MAVIVALLAVSRGIELSGIFSRVAPKVILASRGSPSRLMALITLAVSLSSAVIMNDTAMFVFVPLVVTISRLTGLDRVKAVTVTAIAANVGSALTPIGNPQNIIIWRKYGLEPQEFVVGMAPHVISWLALLALLILIILREEGRVSVPPMPRVRVKKALLAASTTLLILDVALAQAGYSFLGLAITLTTLMLVGREAILSLDIPLILIFTLIFVDFHEVAALASTHLSTAHLDALSTTLLAAALSQIVSNVPATVMLVSLKSPLSWLPLAVGVNVGGTGTVVGSLANLIAVRISGIKLRDFHKYSVPFLLASLTASTLIMAVMLK